MPELVVIVPSRGRPHTVAELAAAFRETCAADTVLLFAGDTTDETWPEYERAVEQANPKNARGSVFAIRSPSTSMVEALNLGARLVLDNDWGTVAVGFLGDDHRPAGAWDREVIDELRRLGTGMTYGDDGIQHEKLPTAIFMTSDIIGALGYMAPPVLGHLYVDNAWLTLGRAAECITYLPHVKVGHIHPVAGLAAWDEGYARCNSQAQYQRDEAAYRQWCATELPGAVAKLRELRTRTLSGSG